MPTFVNSTSGTAGAATSYTSTTRWAYVRVENTAAAGGGVVWVRTDGTAAAAADGSYSVNPGEAIVFANALPLWTQAATVIPASNAGAAAYTGVEFSSIPPEVNPMGTSPYGQTASPGTSVSIFSAGTPTFTISGTG